MIHLPLAARVTAGLVAVVVDEVRKLPQTALSLPITAASQALQTSMRVQQCIAELAIRGDEVFALLDRPSEQPDWATFDDELEEDLDVAVTDPDALMIDTPLLDTPAVDSPAIDTPPINEEPAPTVDTAVSTPDTNGTDTSGPDTGSTGATATGDSDPGGTDPANGANGRFALYTIPPEQDQPVEAPETADRSAPEIVEYLDYDNLTLAQLRARLRSLSTDDLDALLDYENANGQRPPFLTMLGNRITSARAR